MHGFSKATESKFNLLVEFQVKDEGCFEGLYQKAGLGQVDVLVKVKFRRMEMRIPFLKRLYLPSETGLFTRADVDPSPR